MCGIQDRYIGQEMQTRNAKCSIPEATAYFSVLRGDNGAMTSEEGTLQWTVYGKMLSKTTSSEVIG